MKVVNIDNLKRLKDNYDSRISFEGKANREEYYRHIENNTDETLNVFTVQDKPNSKLRLILKVEDGVFKYWDKNNIKPDGFSNILNLEDNGVFINIANIVMGVDITNNRTELGVGNVGNSNPDLSAYEISNTINVSSPTLQGRFTGFNK